MTLSIADRLFETTATTGNGPFTLAGSVQGFQGFASLGTGKKTTYYIDDGDSSGVVQKWMDVIGTVTVSAGITSLSVDQILASSNSGSAVSFGAGTKNVRGGIGAKVLTITDENLNFVRNYGTDAGTANAHAVTLPYPPLAYSDGMEIIYRVGTLNTTAAVTVNVNGLGAKNIKINGADPGIGAFPVGTLLPLIYKAASNTFEVQGGGLFVSLSGGNMTGALNTAKGTDIASAATTDIGAATGNYVTITGTTAITAFGTANAGATRVVRFAGALTLTHNATSLILPGNTNITTAAGDMAEFVSEGSGNWRCIDYQKANGQPVAGSGLSTTSNYLYVRDEKTSGTAGGTSATGNQVRTLNAVVQNTISGASLASNQVTLPAGSYYLKARAPFKNSGGINAQVYVYNVTDAAVIGRGPGQTNGSYACTDNTIILHFTLAATKAISLYQYQSAGFATDGLGVALSQGVEIFAELEIYKVA